MFWPQILQAFRQACLYALLVFILCVICRQIRRTHRLRVQAMAAPRPLTLLSSLVSSAFKMEKQHTGALLCQSESSESRSMCRNAFKNSNIPIWTAKRADAAQAVGSGCKHQDCRVS